MKNHLEVVTALTSLNQSLELEDTLLQMNSKEQKWEMGDSCTYDNIKYKISCCNREYLNECV